MYASKIKMRTGCFNSNRLADIYLIYLAGLGYWEKETMYDYLIKHPGNIFVNIYPYPEIVPAISTFKEKYVKSALNESMLDHLLSLPRE